MAHDPAVALGSLAEVPFCQPGSRGRLGVPWEAEAPVWWQDPGRKSVGDDGAVRLRAGHGWCRPAPARFDGATFWSFLRPVASARQAPGRRGRGIIGNAKDPQAKLPARWRQEVQERCALDFLPPEQPGTQPAGARGEADAQKRPSQRRFPEADVGGGGRRGAVCAGVSAPGGTGRPLSAVIRNILGR